MKKILTILLIAMTRVFAVVVIDNPTSDTIIVNVSNRSVNRIVFPSKILDIAYSKEKGTNIKIAGSQAFIKYTPIQKEEVQVIAKNKTEKSGEPKIVYNKAKPSEIFFITESKTYAFVLNPKNIKAQTIIINDFTKKVKDIIKYETDDSYVTTLAKISKQILKGNSPQGYKIKKNNKLLSSQADLRIKRIKTYEGVIYNVSLIEVYNKINKVRKLNPKEYIKYATEPLKSITIYYNNEVNNLLPYGKAFVVIITKGQK